VADVAPGLSDIASRVSDEGATSEVQTPGRSFEDDDDDEYEDEWPGGSLWWSGSPSEQV
jgi:hypothetical protein